ncbi:MAG: hypothetical protein HXX10_18015 [Rhodoplanes sp.]|uniref:hypothetical protein n=1 Tax=Rhodoplanes sp. TaxID=1968906 RepID=UPI001811DC0B|nr:hypothetical protein [Rhodoplanes sp.]NVO15933.1 hypothetical protein [Rhodoplanes sp.]
MKQVISQHGAIRRRFEDDARLAIRQVGLAYVVLWGVTWWTLDHAPTLLGSGAGCRLESLSDLVVWSCTSGARLEVVADLVNGVLASTVWAPAVVLSAAAQPEVRLLAFAVVGLHLVGLPAALLVAIRFGVSVCDRIARRPPAGSTPPALDAPTGDAMSPASGAAANAAAVPAGVVRLPPARPARPPVTPRNTFGLRQAVPR